ncbi:hypothetical protein LOTGIDRAFT_174141 [Lottia gigantea]|uniref:Fucolectin tachylectin-4 pentraxin-1 domain-containing protein n=1 Tax=Lottia gigantea TaxID=225164 RepID=V4AYA8_LOTGI|nr:hypothetical protein LOTGIDRAFT_174141 [Lottia gigantea]ESO98606.1 hypothetical protein LOTGIDRAFT_174141 [Lottia gigantea]
MNLDVMLTLCGVLSHSSFIQSIALKKPVNMSSVSNIEGACNGVDGSLNSFILIQSEEQVDWWCVDLGKIYIYQSIVIYSNGNSEIYSMNQISGFELRLGNYGQCSVVSYHGTTLCYEDIEPIGLALYNITSCNHPGVTFSSRFIFISPRSYVVLEELVKNAVAGDHKLNTKILE